MAAPITYALRFRGQVVRLESGRLWTEGRAQGGLFVPATGPDGAASRFASFGGGEALCRRELEVEEDGSFVATGEIDFGAGDSLTLRATGEIVSTPLPALRRGTAICEVTGGRGRLAGAMGSIASQLLLADSGEFTDHQLGLLFVPAPTPHVNPRTKEVLP